MAPIRAKKARYYADKRLAARVLPLPAPRAAGGPSSGQVDDWSGRLPIAAPPSTARPSSVAGDAEDLANSGIRREPELQPHEAIAPEAPPTRPTREFDDGEDEPDGDGEAVKARLLQDRATVGRARQVTMDPADHMEM